MKGIQLADLFLSAPLTESPALVGGDFSFEVYVSA